MATNVISVPMNTNPNIGGSIQSGAIIGNYFYGFLNDPQNKKILQFTLTGTLVNNNWLNVSTLPDAPMIYYMISYENYLFFTATNNFTNIYRVTVNPDGSYVAGSGIVWFTKSSFYPHFISIENTGNGPIMYITQLFGTWSVYSLPINSNGTSGTISSSLYTPFKDNNNRQYIITGITYYNSKFYLSFTNGQYNQGIILEFNSNFVLTSNNTKSHSYNTTLSWANNLGLSTENSSYQVRMVVSQNYMYVSNTEARISQLNLDGTVNNINYYTIPSGANGSYIFINESYIYGLYGLYIYIIPLPPPPIQYAKIQMSFNSIINSSPVGGLVFEGYYSYQTNNNRVVSFYSSTDMSTNLLIPHTDSFVTGALTLLGKTSANTAGITGIDTASTHAGVFVKDIPFVNALFKSNPYVLLKPSGCVMFDNYGVVNTNVLATSYFTNKYVMSNGNVYSNKNNSFFSFSNFTFNASTVSALPTVNALLPIDYTFFNTIKQIAYTAKYNGAVVLDSFFVFYLDSSNNYHMCAQYGKTTNKNLLVSSDASCDNFPNTGNFGNTAVTQSTDPSNNTITATSGDAATATVTTSAVSNAGTTTVTQTLNVTGIVAQVNLNALNSNICFSEGSIVSTDQGDVEIQNIDTSYHTIRNNKIIALTETQSMEDYLVKIKMNALGNVPTQDTETTGNHMIFNGMNMIKAKTLINGGTIEKIEYRGLPLYNILLEKHDVMLVNGLVCETLNPENPIAKYYRLMGEHPEKKIEMEHMWRKRTQLIIHPIC